MIRKIFIKYKTLKSEKETIRYTYRLRFDGEHLILEKSWITLSKPLDFIGSRKKIITEDLIPRIEELFTGLSFEFFQYDGIPVFSVGDELIHLVHKEQVTMSVDSYLFD